MQILVIGYRRTSIMLRCTYLLIYEQNEVRISFNGFKVIFVI